MMATLSNSNVSHLNDRGLWDVRIYYAVNSASDAVAHFTNGYKRVNLPNFVPSARTPQDKWSQLNNQMVEDCNLEYFRSGTDIGLIQAPEEIFSSSISKHHHYPVAAARQVLPDALACWIASLSSKGDFAFHRPRLVCGNLVSSTKNENGRYLGLHIDNWEGISVSHRHEARNRLCLNLGPSARFFLAVPISVAELNRVAKEAFSEVKHSELASSIFNRFLTLPIIRLKIEPGQAYIAPTENIIHDGSSIGYEQNSTILTVRGYFNKLSGIGRPNMMIGSFK